MIEHAHVDLADTASRVARLSSPDDARWSAVVVLAPGEALELPAGARTDLLVLRGAASDGADERLDLGDFLSDSAARTLHGGPEGATLLAYREVRQPGAAVPPRVAIARDARPWRRGRTPGMTVASLSNAGHALSLVQWQPGASTRPHTHPRGEEIFVLRGELVTVDARHPEGSWMRLPPGAWHAPTVEVPTMILVRNGHLAGTGLRPAAVLDAAP